MVYFFFKRYLYAVSLRRFWLISAVIPSLVYLVFLATQPDRFTVFQDIAVSKNVPVAISSSPVHFTGMDKIISQPDDFFIEKFALRQLYMQLHVGTDMDQAGRQYAPLIKTISQEMAMTYQPGNRVRIMYQGDNRKNGEMFVSFYSKRLLRKVEEGLRRSKSAAGQAVLIKPGLPAKLAGSMEIKGEQALFRADRILPAMNIFIIFIIIVMLWIGILEWADPSFKSERQVARYLKLPTLGSLPDINKISKTITTFQRS
jgi:hypothetical protein